MTKIVNLNGQQIGGHTPAKVVTKTQAGAILISEIDIAIERWNAYNLELVKGQGLGPEDADLFKSTFEKYEYTDQIKEAQKLFGYAELNVAHVKGDVVTKIYTKAVSFAKETELNNTNAYFPSLAIDCMGFLLASGLMYNLAFIVNNPNKAREPENAKKTKVKATGKSKPDRKDSTGAGDANSAG